jgi:hypothetical protein
MNYLRPFKTCFCEKHVLDLSRHLPRLRFERRSKFSSKSTAPLPGRMRNSPSRPLVREGSPSPECGEGRAITDHLMVRARYLRSIALSIVRRREGAPGSGARPQISRSKPQAANLVGSTSSILSELTIGIARGFMASGTSRTRSMCRSPFANFAKTLSPGGGTRTCASRIKGAPDRRLKPVEAG